MKPIYFLIAGLSLTPVPSNYAQSNLIERDHIEIVYLPNNTCHIRAPADIKPQGYRDYVRACLNNRHLRIKINNPASN
jgi:hypothetical protein